MKTVDRFELSRDNGGRVDRGWRVERYSFGWVAVHHLRSGRVNVGCDDGFGNIVDAPPMFEGPHFNPGEIYNGYMS